MSFNRTVTRNLISIHAGVTRGEADRVVDQLTPEECDKIASLGPGEVDDAIMEAYNRILVATTKGYEQKPFKGLRDGETTKPGNPGGTVFGQPAGGGAAEVTRTLGDAETGGDGETSAVDE